MDLARSSASVNRGINYPLVPPVEWLLAFGASDPRIAARRHETGHRARRAGVARAGLRFVHSGRKAILFMSKRELVHLPTASRHLPEPLAMFSPLKPSAAQAG